MVTDEPGTLLCFLLTGGNRNNICMAKELLEPIDLTDKRLRVDKRYDIDRFVK